MDTVADFLSQIKNAQAVKKERVKLSFSNLRFKMAELLSENDFVGEVKKKGRGTNQSIIINLKYEDGRPKIEEMKRVSKPGQRIYKSANEIEEVRGGYGLGIVSTSQGLLVDTEARKRHLGGEVLCKVW